MLIANRPPSANNRNLSIGIVGPGASANSMGARGTAVQSLVGTGVGNTDAVNSAGARTGFNINAHPSKFPNLKDDKALITTPM